MQIKSVRVQKKIAAALVRGISEGMYNESEDIKDIVNQIAQNHGHGKVYDQDGIRTACKFPYIANRTPDCCFGYDKVE